MSNRVTNRISNSTTQSMWRDILGENHELVQLPTENKRFPPKARISLKHKQMLSSTSRIAAQWRGTICWKKWPSQHSQCQRFYSRYGGNTAFEVFWNPLGFQRCAVKHFPDDHRNCKIFNILNSCFVCHPRSLHKTLKSMKLIRSGICLLAINKQTVVVCRF